MMMRQVKVSDGFSATALTTLLGALSLAAPAAAQTMTAAATSEDLPAATVAEAGTVETAVTVADLSAADYEVNAAALTQAPIAAETDLSLTGQALPNASLESAPATAQTPATTSTDPVDQKAAEAVDPVIFNDPGVEDVFVDEVDQFPSPLLEAEAEFQITLRATERPTVPANGRSLLPLEGQILGAAGQPIDRDVVVTLTASAGEFAGADYDRDRAGFQVLARRGQFQAQLRSTLEAQQVQLRAAVSGLAARGLEADAVDQSYPEITTYAYVQFTTDLRPSLVSGVIDLRIGPGATNFWGSFRDFLNPGDIDDDFEVDLDASLFAIGSFGEWQFTGAFNADRPLNERCDGSNSLFRDVQFCEQTYPVYGDSSTNDFLTPSIDSFYVRFQRDSVVPGAEPDYFMWGDFSTQELNRPSQTFTGVTRQLHGFKGNYTFGNGFQLTALYANNIRAFQRDTLAPDGTSGFYFLSRRLVLRGSENVFLEIEEFNRPGTVLERRPLYRGADYEIDYDRGTLLFRQPIYATEVNPLGDLLVRRIVVTYQVDNPNGGDGNLYAGRLQYTFNNGLSAEDSWIGATALIEDQGVRDFTLFGFDALLPLGETGELVAEVARSNFDVGSTETSGNAYRFEAVGNITSGIRGRAYLTAADSGFTNTATTSFRPGQTRWGGELAARLGPTTVFAFQFDQEDNEGQAPQVLTTVNDLFSPGRETVLGDRVDNRLTTFRAGIQQQLGSAVLGFDWLHRDREDNLANTDAVSNQLVSRFTLPITNTLRFLAQGELNLADDEDPLYPDRTRVGLEWQVQPGVTMTLSQQFAFSGDEPRSITRLDTNANYELDDNTSLTQRYSLLGGFNGITGQGAIGLNHRLILAPGLRATLGFERIYGDAFNLTGAGRQFAQPFAVGQNNTALGLQSSTAFSAGLEYTDNPDFQASARLEHRSADDGGGSNTVLTAAVGGRVTPALTTLFRYRQANYANQLITDDLDDSVSLKLGLAYRNPVSDVFNGLLSYEYRRNPATTPNTILFGAGDDSKDHTLALEGIYAPDWRWEFYGKYALRYSAATLADDFEYANAIHLAQMRATYRFAYRWDITGEARWIGQPRVSYNEVGFAAELGYYLTPNLRLGVGYSFGEANDNSFVGGGGYRSQSGPYLGITFKVNELFNDFGLQMVSPPQQQESYVDSAAAEANPVMSEGGEI
ncbi:TonB-dependent receptor [Almyronema epifaneia]|uniref:TonB-dependent receptor n=1 Tax=Almyronema epifaneia S1 TaxID=2991925 RepID=A0ABW6IC12_9CYAN